MQEKSNLAKLEWLEIALLAAPFLYLAAEWHKFPAIIPIHWNIQGRINGWAPKWPGLLLLPLTTVFLWSVLRFLPSIDPKFRRSGGEERARAMRVMGVIRAVLVLFFSGMVCVQFAISRGYPFSMNAFALNGCLVVFLVIGNFSAKLRPNYFTGIRTPWTLDNTATWRATHRAGGRILVFGSLLLFAVEFFVPSQTFAKLVAAFILGFTFWAFLYSWNHCRTQSVATSTSLPPER